MTDFDYLKATYSSKNRHFIIQERFNEFIYGGFNTIIKCGKERFNEFIYGGFNTIIKCGKERFNEFIYGGFNTIIKCGT